MSLSALSLTELRYLVALSDQEHFGRAARQCHVSQPALSAGIKKLEETLGVRLFERTRRQVHPTALGERIATQARRVIEEAESLVELVRSESGLLCGPLRLGVIPTLGPYLLPHFVQPLQRAFPNLKLVVRESMTAVLLEELGTRRLDAALMAVPVPEEQLERRDLFDEPFWLAIPRAHPLARREEVRETDLAQQKVLLLSEGHCLRDQALEICAQSGAQEDAGDFRATSLETLRQMVAAGMGCTLLPSLSFSAGKRIQAGVTMRPFAGRPPSRRIALYWRRTYSRPDNMEALADSIVEHLPDRVRALTA